MDIKTNARWIGVNDLNTPSFAWTPRQAPVNTLKAVGIYRSTRRKNMRTINPTNVHDGMVNLIHDLHDMRNEAEKACKELRRMVQTERPGDNAEKTKVA